MYTGLSKMTPGFILILVATYLILVGADDFQELNCTDTNNRDAKQDEYVSVWPTPFVAFGVGLVVCIGFPVIIIVCNFCACCPLYKLRMRRRDAFTAAKTQQQPVTFYQVPPYNSQPTNTQTFVPPPYPGFVYSPDHTSPQTPNAPYYSAGNEHQVNPGIGHYAGSPGQPPPYYPNSPPNHNMDTNFTSK